MIVSHIAGRGAETGDIARSKNSLRPFFQLATTCDSSEANLRCAPMPSRGPQLHGRTGVPDASTDTHGSRRLIVSYTENEAHPPSLSAICTAGRAACSSGAVFSEQERMEQWNSREKRAAGQKREAGRVRYWQYGQADNSPDLSISDLCRFLSSSAVHVLDVASSLSLRIKPIKARS